MDSAKTGSPRVDPPNSDGDINLLLYKAGHAVKQFFVAIGVALRGVLAAVMVVVVFLLKNIIWLAIAAAVGAGYGLYYASKNGPEFTSEMVVKANFNSSRSLYTSVEYFNSLIAANGTADLARIFNMPVSEAEQLINFSCTPVKSELIAADLYREEFMLYDRSSRIRVDTFWTRTIAFEDFKKSLTDFDYPYHTIIVKSKNASIFSKLEQGFVAHISQNDLLQDIRNRQRRSNLDEEKLILTAIENLDTLRRAYNKRLTRGENASLPGSNQLTVLETTPDIRTPELDLYDKMLELQAELKKARKRAVTEQDIVEIVSKFSPHGRKLQPIDTILGFTLAGLAVAAIILLSILLYKSASSYERERIAAKKR